MNPTFYVLVELNELGSLYMPFPFMDANTLEEAQNKALYWYKIYNRKKGDITPAHFTLGKAIHTEDNRYIISVYQYPF